MIISLLEKYPFTQNFLHSLEDKINNKEQSPAYETTPLRRC